MNNTTKATLDAARRMLRGKIEAEEVSMMLGLSMEELKPLLDELENEKQQVYGNITAYGDVKDVLFEDFHDLGDNSDMEEEE